MQYPTQLPMNTVSKFSLFNFEQHSHNVFQNFKWHKKSVTDWQNLTEWHDKMLCVIYLK